MKSAPLRLLLSSLACLLPASAANQVLLRHLEIGDNGVADLLAADRNGFLFSVTRTPSFSGRSQMRVIKTDSNGAPVATFDFAREGAEQPTAAATDAQGNLVIVGLADSSRFTPVAPLFPSVTGEAGFILKLDSQLRGILFATLFRARPEAVEAVNYSTFHRRSEPARAGTAS